MDSKIRIDEITAQILSIDDQIQSLSAQKRVLLHEKSVLRDEILSQANEPTEEWEKDTFSWFRSLQKGLEDLFGFKEFRSKQLPAMNALLSAFDKGFALVVSPLISLMEDQDQVDSIHKNMTCDKSTLRLIYVTPEPVDDVFLSWGLTATLTGSVLKDVREMLNIPDCVVFKASLDRPNIHYRVMLKPSSTDTDILYKLITKDFKNQCGIVYVLTIKQAETSLERIEISWRSCCCGRKERLKIVIATTAFGMGIDKSNVRFVIHYNLPKSVDNFYQESGRAGRDGSLSYSIVLFNFDDIFKSSVMAFTEKSGINNLYRIVEYCISTTKCRRTFLSNYFGNNWGGEVRCDKMCDHCDKSLLSVEMDISTVSNRNPECSQTSIQHGAEAKVAVCTLNQWSLDFEGNFQRIITSIRDAKASGAKLRSGPELEVTGYNCQDHFYESDTLLHAWEVVASLLNDSSTSGILVDVGIPIMHKNQKRMFVISEIIKSVPFGDGVIATEDTSIGYEIGDELRNPNSSHIEMGNDGVEIFINGSASYMELRKAHINVDLIQNATLKNGGCYLYSNLRGCDGDRVYFQGNSCISLNGDIISRTRQYGIEEIEIATATLDLVSIRSYRNSLVNKCNQAMNECTPYPRVPVDFSLSEIEDIYIPTHIPLIWDYHTPEQEIMLGISCWLWDYLRRSGQVYPFLSTQCVQMVIKAVERGDEQALHDIRRVVGESDYVPIEPKELCSRIFVTCFMGSESAPEENKSRAKKLAQQIVTGVIPKFRSRGGSIRENLALQNVQSRVKMVISYLFAQLMLWARNRAGGLLVLGSTNIDDCLRGFITKYDCSSADINPIGSISKIDLKYFLLYAKNEHNFTSLEGIINELEPETLPPPSTNHRIYSEEADMGMTYEELSQYGKLRMTERCGPHSMFNKLTHSWRNKASPDETAKKRVIIQMITDSIIVLSYITQVGGGNFELSTTLYEKLI
ncbi:E6.3.5.1 [Lepeophtheirus salmonis]|uniref:Glutamine-dependent NAD(+) synthetase n=1 Tax=Lepeophtheirus salmonis TaxID=72036 RepID=A0A7R8CMM9_LEPSM|nr:E6.3.5.1 [Lepeophtheirus salmonis]CAF2867754.1 E6.3.5.1 [Lepeophtheirus salmonis]